ncbi:MAG: hypothetical protein WKG00_03165 [Polyangiaceae bacterium]
MKDRRGYAATRVVLSGVEVAVTDGDSGTRYWVPRCIHHLPAVVGHGTLAAAETCAAIVAERRERTS